MGKRFRRFSLALAGFAMALGAGVAVGVRAAGTPMETRATDTGTFEKVTGLCLTPGADYVITYGSYVMGNTISSSKVVNYALADFDGSQSSIANPEVETIWTLNLVEINGEQCWTFYNADAGKYLKGNIGSSNVSLASNLNDSTSKWILTAPSLGTFDFSVNGATNRILRNNGDYGWAGYSSSTGDPLTLYKKTYEKTVSEISNMSATVTAKPDADSWKVSNVFVSGTLDGVPNSDVTDYVDVASTAPVPPSTSDEYPVSFDISSKGGVSLSSLSVNAKVSTDEFISYSLVTDSSEINAHSLYALGNLGKNKFATNLLSGTGIPTSTTNDDIGLFRLKPASEGTYFLQFVTGTVYQYPTYGYCNNTVSKSNLTFDAVGSTEWSLGTDEANKVYLYNSANSNLFLSIYSNNVRTYDRYDKIYLYAVHTDYLSSIELIDQTTVYVLDGEHDVFSFDGSIDATYSISGTTGHTGITSGFTCVFDDDESVIPNPLTRECNGRDVRVTYTDSWGASASATYTIYVRESMTSGLTWDNRGTIDCFEGTAITDAVKFTDWSFDGTYYSGNSFEATSWENVGVGEEDIHLGLYDTATPIAEGDPLPTDYVFQASDNGKYLVAYYLGVRSNENQLVTVTPLLNAIPSGSYYYPVTSNLMTNANIVREGTDGIGSEAMAICYGFTVSSEKGYFEDSEWHFYSGEDLVITSSAGKSITSIGLSFRNDYSKGGLDTTNPVSPSSSVSLSVSGTAHITSIEVTYRENDYANENLPAQKAVIEFANYLNGQMAVDGVCGTSESNYGVHTSGALKTAWEAVQDKYTELFVSGPSALTGDNLTAAQNMLAKATAKWDNDPDCLQRAMKTYDFVVTHYSAELTAAGMDTPAFMSAIRTPSGVARVNSISYAGETMNPALLVVILAGLSAAVVGVYFFLKRRQERE